MINKQQNKIKLKTEERIIFASTQIQVKPINNWRTGQIDRHIAPRFQELCLLNLDWGTGYSEEHSLGFFSVLRIKFSGFKQNVMVSFSREVLDAARHLQ